MNAFFYGLTIGFSLILAIGAQNAFVLKQGLKKQHVFWVCLICALSDAVLMTLGVSGFAQVVEQHPIIITVAKYLGAAFLFWYGLMSLKSALTNKNALTPQGKDEDKLGKVILICLSFTWLNPHVYLDTLILIGSISTQFEHKLHFASGAILSSFIFFFALGFGARFLEPLFKKPKAWVVLDAIIAVVMWVIAVNLLFFSVS